MEKTLIQKPNTITYSINFNFTSERQKQILRSLQENNYKLIGFKGASGPNQISLGVPAWFAINYQEMFGVVEVNCELRYKVYVFNKANINPDERIRMQSLSEEIPLGTIVTFHQDGSFSTSPGTSGSTIIVKNNRVAGSPDVIVGLAAKVNRSFQPFCAFKCASQGSVNIMPSEKIVLFAARNTIESGDLIFNTIEQGCSFAFSYQNIEYDLEMIPGTYGITHAPGGAFVYSEPAGRPLAELLSQ